jgi:hypothetical protein
LLTPSAESIPRRFTHNKILLKPLPPFFKSHLRILIRSTKPAEEYWLNSYSDSSAGSSEFPAMLSTCKQEMAR